jgi:RimJ/RimL family protein N-acetyltransferase
MSFAAEVPRVETARLILRGPRREDFDAYSAMWGDPAIVRLITGEPLSREAAWAKFLRDAGHWALMGFGFWCVTEKSSDRYAGQLGFADFQRDLEPSFDGALEMGWSLASWAHGQGFASEAVRAALGWAAAHHAGKRIVCMINDDNAPSIRVAEKAAFRPYARANYKGKAVALYQR